MSANKIDALVDFPVTGLDLTDVVKGKRARRKMESSQHNETEHSSGVDPDQKTTSNNEESFVYDLFAVSNHFGGLGGGHYTAYAKNPLDEQWYNFDDSHVAKVDEDSVKRRNRNSAGALKETLEQIKVRDPIPSQSSSSYYYNNRPGGYGNLSPMLNPSRKLGQFTSSNHTFNSTQPSGSDDEGDGIGQQTSLSPSSPFKPDHDSDMQSMYADLEPPPRGNLELEADPTRGTSEVVDIHLDDYDGMAADDGPAKLIKARLDEAGGPHFSSSTLDRFEDADEIPKMSFGSQPDQHDVEMEVDEIQSRNVL
ncbi:hypothetical protein HDU96_002583 [Phlyctochytrium bullatum]|nr:hypothetical protein HDU96_002583 [Phlyctochytrium bullatum]